MLNKRENYLRAIRNECPEWVPAAGEAVVVIKPPVCERPKVAAKDAVVAEVKRRIDELALPNGGYIIGSSHSVPYDKEKLDAMRKTIKEYGAEIYKR